MDETWCVLQIAIALSMTGHMEKAIEIFYALKASMEKTHIEGYEMTDRYLGILNSLTWALGVSKRHKECLPICDEGIAFSKMRRNSHYHPLFMSNKAYNLLYLERAEEAITLIKKVYAYFYAQGRYVELSQIKEPVEREFNIKIDSIELP
jgi:hypothetical protein